MDCCDLPEDTAAVRGFVALWHGQRPLADPAAIAALREAGRIEVDPDGRLAAIHGLTTRPSPHRISHPGGTINTWCAFDALGIPAALGLDARATTTCPTCGTELQVPFTAGHPAPADDLRLWLPQRPCTHLIDDFCAHANLYCSPAHLAAHTQGPGRPTTITEAADLGRATWSGAAAAVRLPEAST